MKKASINPIRHVPKKPAGLSVGKITASEQRSCLYQIDIIAFGIKKRKISYQEQKNYGLKIYHLRSIP